MTNWFVLRIICLYLLSRGSPVAEQLNALLRMTIFQRLGLQLMTWLCLHSLRLHIVRRNRIILLNGLRINGSC